MIDKRGQVQTEDFCTIDWNLMSREDRALLREAQKALSLPETSLLATGKLLVKVRPILEKYGEFLRFLRNLPSTERTYYRRIKTYERATAMWPQRVVDAAIERRLQVIGWSEERPMGAFEDVDTPPTSLTPKKIEEFLERAETEVRRGAAREDDLDFHQRVKVCFRSLQLRTAGLPPKDRERFLREVVAVQMTLLGVEGTEKFSSAPIPPDFWITAPGSQPKSQETRNRISKGASARWARLRQAKEKSA